MKLSVLNLSFKQKLHVMVLFNTIICILTVFAISYFKSRDNLLVDSKEKVVILRDIAKKRIQDYLQNAEAFTSRLAHDRLVEGMFLAYESAFYGGGFVIGDDQSIHTNEYTKLGGTYLERARSMMVDYKFADFVLATIDSQIVFSVNGDIENFLLGKNISDGSFKDTPLSVCFEYAKKSDGNEVFLSSSMRLGDNKSYTFMCMKQLAEFKHLSEGIKIGDAMGIVISVVGLENINGMIDTMISRKDGSSLRTYIVGEDKVGTEENPVLELALDGKEDIGIFDVNDETYLSAYSFIESSGKKWAIVSEVLMSEIMKPVFDMLLFMLLASIIILTAVSVIGISFANKIISPIISFSTTLRKVSRELSKSSDAMSKISNKLSASATQQSAAMTETASSLDALNEKVEQNMQHANQSYDVAHKVKEVSDHGNKSIDRAIRAMEQINESNAQIEALVDVINEIGAKTKVVDDIVFKTSLLSFNASIEAARAGQHGRGFSVVAEEVGSLSRLSGTAARQINEIVVKSVNRAKVIIDENKKRVADGAGQVGETATILREINNSSDMVVSTSEGIVESSREQADGIKEITKSVKEVQGLSSSNDEMASETRHFSDELADRSKVLLELVESVNDLLGMHAANTKNEQAIDN